MKMFYLFIFSQNTPEADVYVFTESFGFYLPVSYTSTEPWRDDGLQATEAAATLLASASDFPPSLSGELPALALCWLWFLTAGSSRGLNLWSKAAAPWAGYEWSMGWWWRWRLWMCGWGW